MPKTEMESHFEKFIRQLKLKPTVFDLIEAMYLRRYQTREEEIREVTANVQETALELRAQQKAKMEAFVATKSTILRTQLEKDIEELEERVKAASDVTETIQITKDDIRRFKEAGKYVVEHLPELLLKPANSMQKLTVLMLIFDSLPTYTDILNGTGKLAQPLTISAADIESGLSVCPSGFSWNTIERIVQRWNEAFDGVVTYAKAGR